jgi:hypothetical protein
MTNNFNISDVPLVIAKPGNESIPSISILLPIVLSQPAQVICSGMATFK